ncbi:MAG: DUF4132 domain-containing protein [Myxococcota bacterium]
MPRYEFRQGTSSKFWEIALTGTSYTTTYGRIGTSGQSKTKEFATDDESRRAYEQAIASKVKKGYVEAAGASGAKLPSALSASTTSTNSSATESTAVVPSTRGDGPADSASTSDPQRVSDVAEPEEESATDKTVGEERDPSRLGVLTIEPKDRLVPADDAQPPNFSADRADILYAQINDATRAQIKPAIERGAHVHAETTALAQQVTWTYYADSTPGQLDMQVEAAAFAAMTSAPSENPNELPSLFVRYWLAHTGVDFALKAWLSAIGDFGAAAYNFGRSDMAPRIVLVTEPTRRTTSPADGAAAVLQHAIDRLDEGERAQIYEQVQAHTASATPEARVAFGLVFRDFTALRAELTKAPDQVRFQYKEYPEYVLRGLQPDDLEHLFSLLSAGECVALIAFKTTHWRSEYRADRIETLLHLHGTAAINPLVVWIKRCVDHLAKGDPYSGVEGPLMYAIEFLACVADSPPLAAAYVDLLTRLDKRKFSKDRDPKVAAHQRLLAMPHAALPLIKRSRAKWAQRLLKNLERLTGQAERVEDAPLESVPTELRSAAFKKAPEFWNPSLLPQVRLHEGKALPSAAVEALGKALASSDGPALEAAASACTADSLARFVWELFLAWNTAGGPNKQKWAMMAVGRFGDDECARELTPFIRRWPGESQHKRAVNGLDVLAEIGSDTAMMCLNGVAQKIKYKGLQRQARARMDDIAKRRGLTKEELEDRLVPDLGLEDDGSLELDFGPRSFRVGFDETLTPYVVDAKGKRRKSLPKAAKADDSALAEEATARFKGMKKDVRALAKIEIGRLERAMGRRSWSAADFEVFLVDHTLMIHLTRRLVWTARDAVGVAHTFRVAEDRTYATIVDDPFELGEDSVVSLTHRLELTDDDVARWSTVFRDYELQAPFSQLDREIFRLAEGEYTDHAITRFEGRVVETSQVRGLQSRGWRHGEPQDAGVFHAMGKPLRGEEHAWLSFANGIGIQAGYDEATQTLGVVEFSVVEPWGWSSQPTSGARAIADVDAVTISEVLRDVESLRGPKDEH